jgi:hypothetical protein
LLPVGSLLHENGCGVYVLNPRLDGLSGVANTGN